MKEKIGFKDIMLMLIGMFIVSGSIYYIMMPSHMVIGSLSGLVMVLAVFIPLRISTLTFILNAILLVLGFILIGKDFGLKTVITSILLPVYLWIFEVISPAPPELTDNILVNLFCYVITLSLGQMLLFNINASSGGLDIVGKILNKYLRTDIGQSCMIAGFVIAASSILVYDRNTLIISLLGTYFGGVFLDRFMDGSHIRKRVNIISTMYPEIQMFIVNKLHRGATLYKAIGAWDGKERYELVCILQKNEYAQLLEYVSALDPDAFVTVSTVGAVIGKWNPHQRKIKDED